MPMKKSHAVPAAGLGLPLTGFMASSVESGLCWFSFGDAVSKLLSR